MQGVDAGPHLDGVVPELSIGMHRHVVYLIERSRPRRGCQEVLALALLPAAADAAPAGPAEPLPSKVHAATTGALKRLGFGPPPAAADAAPAGPNM